jgi:hypothetical protein
MITTIKTKQPVIYNERLGLSDIIYLDVNKVSVNDEMYVADSEYYRIENDTKFVIEITQAHFTRTEAKQLFNLFQVEGDDFDTQLFNLIPLVTLQTVGNQGYWGLTSDDWEIVI